MNNLCEIVSRLSLSQIDPSEQDAITTISSPKTSV